MKPVDMADLKDWVGRTTEAEDLVTQRLAKSFRATLEPHLAPVEADEASLGLHWCLAPQIAAIADTAADGHPVKGGYLPPVPLPRRMWAGGEVEISAPLRIGDSVVRTSTIADVVAKEGRSGPLCFVIVRHQLVTERGVAIRERQDIVYRGAATHRAKRRPEPPPPAGSRQQNGAATVWAVDPSPLLLFRYSALTFNGHRIHYDPPYATDTEGYPGLLVHGPLQATLLLNLAATIGDRAPHRVRYRGLAPLIAGRNFQVSGHASGDKVVCSTRDDENRIFMEAEATW